jgi:hypothetical protein
VSTVVSIVLVGLKEGGSLARGSWGAGGEDVWFESFVVDGSGEGCGWCSSLDRPDGCACDRACSWRSVSDGLCLRAWSCGREGRALRVGMVLFLAIGSGDLLVSELLSFTDTGSVEALSMSTPLPTIDRLCMFRSSPSVAWICRLPYSRLAFC